MSAITKIVKVLLVLDKKSQTTIGTGERKRLGYFDTAEEARQAYLTAKRELHPTAPERCYAAP